MSNATLRTAFAFFVDDIETACDIFVAEAESVANGPIGDIDELDSLIDEILENAEPGLKDGLIVVERAAIEALRIPSSDPSDDLQDPLDSFNWKLRKALRELKAALVRETVGAAP